MKVLITLAVLIVALSAVLLDRSSRSGVTAGSVAGGLERPSGGVARSGGGGW